MQVLPMTIRDPLTGLGGGNIESRCRIRFERAGYCQRDDMSNLQKLLRLLAVVLPRPAKRGLFATS